MRKLSGRATLVALLCNYFTVFHLALMVAGCVVVPGWGWKVGTFAFLLYLFPVVCTRIVLAVHPLAPGKYPIGSRDYWVWWFTFCSQALYLRVPALEEFLRCLPGCYSVWLRLWGARVGKLTYWGAGTTVLDRPFLKIGDHCGMGAGVRLSGHLHVENELWLAPVDIEDDVVVGAYSLLGPGTVVKAGTSTRAMLLSSPFSVWSGERRVKNDR